MRGTSIIIQRHIAGQILKKLFLIIWLSLSKMLTKFNETIDARYWKEEKY
jgi:hypothetical protein